MSDFIFKKKSLVKEDLIGNINPSFEDMCKKIAEERDNAIARAFVQEACELLKEHGINMVLSVQDIPEKCITVFRFVDVDTSEHDRQVRVEAFDDLLSSLSKEVAYSYKGLTYSDIERIAERLKEGKK